MLQLFDSGAARAAYRRARNGDGRIVRLDDGRGAGEKLNGSRRIALGFSCTCRSPARSNLDPQVNHSTFAAVVNPGEELRDAVDLIVVAAVGKLHHLDQKILEPWRALGQVHLARLDLR